MRGIHFEKKDSETMKKEHLVFVDEKMYGARITLLPTLCKFKVYNAMRFSSHNKTKKRRLHRHLERNFHSIDYVNSKLYSMHVSLFSKYFKRHVKFVAIILKFYKIPKMEFRK